MKKLFLALALSLSCHLAAAVPLPGWVQSGLSAQLGNWDGASAVVVHSAHVARFDTATHVTETTRIVLRIGTAVGRKDATFGDKYSPGTEKILNASAWVIGRNGKMQKFFKRGDYTEDFATYHSVMWDNDRILSLDLSHEVELGGYVAFEIEKESSSPIYEITHFVSDELPCLGSTLEVTPPTDLSLKWYATLPAEADPTAGSAPGSLRWTIGRTDKKSENLPKGFVEKSRAIMVRCARPAGSAMDQSSWSSLAADVAGVFAPAVKADSVIRAKAAALTAGIGDRWGRVRALCEFAQRDIRYIQITLGTDYLAGYRPHGAPEVLKNRYGDCKDKASLLVALLEGIGERAHMVVVYAGNPLEVHEGWPSPRWFNHVIVGIPADSDAPSHWPAADAGQVGRMIIFDPTNPVAPLGVLAAVDQGGLGLVAAEKGGGLIRLPRDVPAQNCTEQHIIAKLDPDFLLKIHINTIGAGSGGSDSYLERLYGGDVEFGRTLETELHQSFARVDNFKWTDSWDGVASRHTIDRRFSTASYAKPLGPDRMIVQPGILTTDMALPVLARFDGYVAFPAVQTIRTSSLKLPAGWAVADLPKPSQAEEKYLSWDISCSCEDGRLLYHVRISQQSAVADHAIYEEIRREHQRLDELLRSSAVLTRSKGEEPSRPSG